MGWMWDAWRDRKMVLEMETQKVRRMVQKMVLATGDWWVIKMERYLVQEMEMLMD